MVDVQCNEVWRALPGHEGIYSVSSDGRIRSELKRKMWAAGRILAPQRQKSGYRHVTLCANGQQRQWLVHRLVMLAFVGECPPGLQVNHKNGIKDDNRLANLEYVTPRDNQLHKHEVLGVPRHSGATPRMGEAHQNAKLTDDMVRAIRAMHAAGGMTQKEIGKRVGIGQTGVSKIVRRILWPHVV